MQRSLAETDPDIADAIRRETRRQAEGLELIASENFVSAAVLEAARMAPLFDARVDGRELTRLALNGKPAPEAFLAAVRDLGPGAVVFQAGPDGAVRLTLHP